MWHGHHIMQTVVGTYPKGHFVLWHIWALNMHSFPSSNSHARSPFIYKCTHLNHCFAFKPSTLHGTESTKAIDDTCSQSLIWYNNDIKTVNNDQLVSETRWHISFSFASYCNKKHNNACFTSQFITNNILYAHYHVHTYLVFAKHTFADLNSRHSWFSQC